MYKSHITNFLLRWAVVVSEILTFKSCDLENVGTFHRVQHPKWYHSMVNARLSIRRQSKCVPYYFYFLLLPPAQSRQVWKLLVRWWNKLRLWKRFAECNCVASLKWNRKPLVKVSCLKGVNVDCSDYPSEIFNHIPANKFAGHWDIDVTSLMCQW